MKIEVSTGPDFDHTAFTRDIAAKVTEVTEVGISLRQKHMDPATGPLPFRVLREAPQAILSLKPS
jgi:hypothetical protein